MSDNIQVAIKVRPLIKREKEESLQIQWSVVDNIIVPLDPEKKRNESSSFQFDHIFDPDKTNQDVFETVVKPIVDGAVKGFNGTVFAYGQTSSGKTYTMLGTPSEPGVIPMAVEHTFDSIAETCGREFLLRVSYFEIYNEKVNDLLDPSLVDLKLREDSNGLVQVLKCKEEIASSPEAIMAIMRKGDKNRRTGETDMNERSSRSHTIFRITIESREQSNDSDGAIQVSQLNLVDLAGSERVRQTNATGERFKEGTHINLSLSSLALVIKQLSESSDTAKFINFRDSKLTRMLQASLGGNAMTTIICAVTPAAFEETQCTLWFASRAKSVKNKPQLNEVVSDATLLKRYKKQLTKLNEELEKIKHDNRVAEVQEMESKLQEKEHRLQETDRLNQILEERIQLLKNGLISADSASKEETNTKLPRSKRRRTWGGDRLLHSRLSLGLRNLPTIQETSLETKLTTNEKLNDMKRRKSIIQTVNLNDESFETAFTDFELELIKVAKEREEHSSTIIEYAEEKDICNGKPKSENRVKFHNDVEVYRLSTGSNWSDMSTPEKLKPSRDDRSRESVSPGTPKAVLRERLSYLTEEYNALQEFTTLERQIMFAQEKEFESPTEKIFMQNEIDGLLEKLEKYNTYQTELEEQVTLSLNCINELSSRTPDILELWNPSLFSDEKGEVDTIGELKQLHKLLKDLKNEQNNAEKALTPLEKKLTYDYNECLKKLEQVQSEKELLVKENTDLKDKLTDESTKLKNTDILINTLRTDTDCLMEKLIQKNSELAKLKERVVDLEKLSQELDKSLTANKLEASMRKENDANVSLQSKSIVGDDQEKDIQIVRLNEIIEEKTVEIMKYRQFEEEIKVENERLQQMIDAATNIERKSEECQTDDVLDKEININLTNDVNHEKDQEITKLSEMLEEKTNSINNYQKLEMEMKQKIEELEQYLKEMNKDNVVSQESQTENVFDCKTENILLEEKNIETSRLSNVIQEKILEIENYKQIEEQLREEINRLQNLNSNAPVERKTVDSQTSDLQYDKEDSKKLNETVNSSEIVRLEKIIEEKSLEVSKYMNSEEEARREVERLQLQLNSVINIDKASQNCQTEDIIDDKQIENSITNYLNESKSNEISGLLELIQSKSNEIERYKQSEEEMKIEMEQLQQRLNKIKETTNQECQTEQVTDSVDVTDFSKEKDHEISRQSEIIQQKDQELEKYKETEEVMKKEIERLQQNINEINNVKFMTAECQTESAFENENHSQANLTQEADKELSKQSEIVQEKLLEIQKYQQMEEEMKAEIQQLQERVNSKVEQVSTECQTECAPDSEAVCESGFNHSEDNKISQLSEVIQQKELEIVRYQQANEETNREIERLQQRLDSALKIERVSEGCQTECVLEIGDSNKEDTNINKDDEISKLTTTIQEKDREIAAYKLANEASRKEIECLQQRVDSVKVESSSQEIKMDEPPVCEDQSTMTDLATSNQTKAYQEDIANLNSLNSMLQSEIEKKTNEICNLQQISESKVQQLEKNIEIIIIERNELKEKIEAAYGNNTAQDFEKETTNLRLIIDKLKVENENLKHRLQAIEIDTNKANVSVTMHEHLAVSTIPGETSLVKLDISVNNAPNNSVQHLDVKKESIPVASSDTDNFVRPADVIRMEPKDSMSAIKESSNEKNIAQPLNKFDIESSSIFANMSYFDNMEVGQSFTQDCTGLITGIDDSKDISNLSTHIDASMASEKKPSADNITFVETSMNNSKSENVEPETFIKTEIELLSIEEFRKIKVTLEKENARLHYDLQKKIQETEEVQGVIRDFKQTLEELQQTICILTNENMDMSKQLTEARENNTQIFNDFQTEIETLTARLSAITEEKISLTNELAVVNEQFETMRAITPVVTDDDMKNKFHEYQEKIKALTEENIDLSTNLMEKIEELEKVKESKIQLFDHDCTYREKSEAMAEKIQCLEKENIELSSELTEQIEECDKLKETADVLKQQLDVYTSQQASENSTKGDFDFLKDENTRLTDELIQLRAKLIQMARENANLSTNIALEKSDELSHSVHGKTLNLSSAELQTSIYDGSSSEANNIPFLKQRVKSLEEQVEHLTLLNKKLGELKLTHCNQCVHLKELNESRRKLKLEVKSLNQKLSDLQKDYEQKCADTEVLRAKANEDINSSLCLLDSTLNGSIYEGMNVTVVEEKVQNLHREIEELKENHSKLSNQYKEKCNELEKLQFDNTLVSPSEKEKVKRTKADTPSRKASSRLQNMQKSIDSLSVDLQDIKKRNINLSAALNKFMAERNETVQEMELLRSTNEVLKKDCSSAEAIALNHEEKIRLLEEELGSLYKRLEATNTREQEIQTQKLNIEVRVESLLKDKEELTSSLQNKEDAFRKEIEECKTHLQDYEKENINLKNELQKLEDTVQQLKAKNQNFLIEKLQDEIDSAKSRIMKEIKSLTNPAEKEWKELPKKSIVDIFVSFLNAILSKETEIVKRLEEHFERTKRKLEEEKQQSIDAEKRTNVWAKTVESDLEKLQGDLTQQEHTNRRLQDVVHRLEDNLKELQYENQQLHNNIANLESDINSLHNELDKKSQTSIDRDSAISVAQEKERLARSKEKEWEDRLRQDKEMHKQEMEDLNGQLESYKSINDDLRSTVEGLDLEIEHLKNTIDAKTNDYTASLNKIQELQREIECMEEINQQLKNENLEKNNHVDEITGLLKIKCDLLTEYKTKVETMKPEYESLQAQITERKMLIEKYKEEIHNLKLENKKQLDVLQDKLSEEDIKSAGLNKQLAELKNKNTALCSTIEEFKDRCAELERENANLQRKVRNSTSKVKVESEMQELQDENRSLKNHLEGSYNRIKELQETKSQVQRELTEAQGKLGLLEQELNTTKLALDSLREKYNNVNLQKLREKYELLSREKSSVVLEVEEKKMLIANKNQKLVEYGIEMDTLKKQKEALDIVVCNIKQEKSALENRISELMKDSELLKERITSSNIEKDKAYKLIVEEKNTITIELKNCQEQMAGLVSKNKELDEEMDELVKHILKQENEIADLHDRLITGSSGGNLDKLKSMEDENERLKIDLRVTEVNRTKLQSEVVRLNSEKERLLSRIDDLNSKIAELESKNLSRSSSINNSPTTQKGRRRRRRSDLYNQIRKLDHDNDNDKDKDTTDTESPSLTPTPPLIKTVDEECRTCIDLRNRIREMSLDLVSRNNKITTLEVQLQSENFPYQMKCKDLQENLLTVKTRNSELKLEIEKLQRALMKDSARECQICRHKNFKKRDQAVQVNPETKISLTGMSSGLVEDHLRLEKMEKERNMMKELCRSRSRKIKELEQRLREVEDSKTS